MLMPTRVKYRKSQRGRMKGCTKAGAFVSFGEFGLQALEAHWITARQIEAVRVTLARFLKKGGKVWIRIFPDKPISKKPLETRMGTGKADVDYWAARIKPGTMLFEMAGVSEKVAKSALVRVAMKMPFRCRFVGRRIRV